MPTLAFAPGCEKGWQRKTKKKLVRSAHLGRSIEPVELYECTRSHEIIEVISAVVVGRCAGRRLFIACAANSTTLVPLCGRDRTWNSHGMLCFISAWPQANCRYFLLLRLFWYFLLRMIVFVGVFFSRFLAMFCLFGVFFISLSRTYSPFFLPY